ncbi:MAG: hypothetical protein MUO19_08305 [Dehalococcoidales bacterium]|nr:hypothetical protein [Dehalococcoidales bacterium]
MVENTGTTLRADTYRPVNVPEPVQVEEDAAGLPVKVRLPRRQTITDIEDRWRIDDEWWRREPVTRFYYAVRLGSGQRLVLYRNLVTGEWYRQAY